MDTLPDSVTMSTSHSAEASADDVVSGNSGGHSAAQTAVLCKIRERGLLDVADLPQARDEPLWGAIRDEHDLSLGELSALKNFACAVVTRPRGVLPRIESGTVYRVSDEHIRAKFTISNQVHDPTAAAAAAGLFVWYSAAGRSSSLNRCLSLVSTTD
jgi:hypothetical protein